MKYTQILTLFALLVFAAAMLPGTVLASPPAHAPAWGYYKQAPGQVKKEYRYEYRADDVDEMRSRVEDFRAWIREHMLQWRMMHMGWYTSDYDNYSTNTRVVTGTATSIDDDRATLRAHAYLGDDDEVKVWFEYGTSVSDLDETSAVVTVDDDQAVTKTITGLEEDTRYYYRAVLEDEEGDEHYGTVRSFTTHDADAADGEPTLTTRSAQDVDDDRADLRGSVNMEDFENGRVFFVYGTSRTQVEDVADDYDTYAEIDEDGELLRKVQVDSELDGSASYTKTVTGLDSGTKYYYVIVVEYEDADDDPLLKQGTVMAFTALGTNEDAPTLTALSAQDVQDDRADLRGAVDMNDYDNGTVFFVYGTDRNLIEDVADDYDSFAEIDEDDERLQKFEVDDDLDGSASYTEQVTGLEPDTLYYYVIGVSYEDEDDDAVLLLGSIRSLRTDE